MRRASVVSPIVVAFLLALPLPALAGQPQSQAEHSVTGTVVYVGPVAFALDTGTKVETFRIPPGAAWGEQLVPNAEVTLTWKAVPVREGRAVVRLEPAATRSANSRVTGTVEGRIDFIDPAEMAVETERGVETFALQPGSSIPAGLVAGDDVRVTYTTAPATVVGAARAAALDSVHARQTMTCAGCGASHARASMAMRHQSLKSVTGEVAFATPDLIVLQTDRGLEDFAVGRGSRLHGVFPGDDVRVRYRTAGTAARRAVIVSYPDILHAAS